MTRKHVKIIEPDRLVLLVRYNWDFWCGAGHAKGGNNVTRWRGQREFESELSTHGQGSLYNHLVHHSLDFV